MHVKNITLHANNVLTLFHVAYLASISSSLREMETSTVHMVVEPDPEQILHSEKFRQSLKVMERMVLMNTNQHKLAAYRGLSILKGNAKHSSNITHYFPKVFGMTSPGSGFVDHVEHVHDFLSVQIQTI